MLTAVLAFIVLNVLFELALLIKFSSAEWLTSSWHFKVPTKENDTWTLKSVSFEKANALHIAMFIFNLIIHFGTVTGTMSAIGAAAASVITVPLAIFILVLKKEMAK